jgi:MarR family transcriptional regulator, organic hydroperoxide resistance regulator
MAQRAPRPTRRSAHRIPRRGARGEDAAAVIDALRRLFRAIQEYSKAVQSRSGLSSPQLWALQIVGAHPGVSIGELSERMFAHPSTVSGVVDRLEGRGALRRETDERDRRGVRLTLTARGRGALRRSPQPVQSGLARALEQMPRAQLALFRRTLDEVVRQTEAVRA